MLEREREREREREEEEEEEEEEERNSFDTLRYQDHADAALHSIVRKVNKLASVSSIKGNFMCVTCLCHASHRTRSDARTFFFMFSAVPENSGPLGRGNRPQTIHERH